MVPIQSGAAPASAPIKAASTVKARGRTQRVARTVMGTSFGRGWSILLPSTAVNVERTQGARA